MTSLDRGYALREPDDRSRREREGALHTTALWPTLEEFERTNALVQEAHDELERLSWRIDPVSVVNGDETLSFKELGMLTAFVSFTSLSVEPMERMVGLLAQARDAICPLDAAL